MQSPYYYRTIEEVQEHLRAEQVSPVEIVEAVLKRIHKLSHRLNAFITVFDDDAIEQAKQAEAEISAGRWRGPLHGIPLGVKHFYETGGRLTTAAFEHFKNRSL